MTRLSKRRSLLVSTVFTALTLALAGCGNEAESEPNSGGETGVTIEPTTAAASSGTTPSASSTAVEIEVDMAPARTVAVALATGNTQDVDVGRYLVGDAVERADQIIAAGQDTNAQTLARFGTVHHATTLNEFEKAEYSQANGTTMLTVITFGWDAQPNNAEIPQAMQAYMMPGGPGTLAWYFTLQDTGLINGIWTKDELGDFD